MSDMSTDIWRSTDSTPLLWVATAALAFLAHVTMLQVGVSAYQAQLVTGDDAPPIETKIIATAFQAAGAEAPPPPELQAAPVVATTPEPLAAQTLTATAPVSQTLQATVAPPQSAEAVETLAPEPTPEPVTATPVEPDSPTLTAEPEPPALATSTPTETAQTAAQAPDTPTPVELESPTLSAEPDTPTITTSTPIETAQTTTPALTTQAPETPRLNQPGVAPIALAPVAPSPAAPAQVQAPAQVETAALAAPVSPPPLLQSDPTPVPVVQPEPEPAPEPIPDPEPAPVAAPNPEPAPLPDLANALPPPPSGLDQDQAGIASPNAPEQTTEQAQNTYDTVLDFLRSFDGGKCFAALPVLAEDGSFRFETFAGNRADLTRFRQALEIETGTLPGTVMKPVSQTQCEALPFVTAAARYPEFRLYFDVEKREIASGDLLSGRLGNTLGGFVSLLLIDDEGVVQDLGSFLKFRPGYAGFDIPMTLQGSPVETQQLLMALSTKARLKTLASLSGEQAEGFFQKLALEILLQGGGEDVALVAFSVR